MKKSRSQRANDLAQWLRAQHFDETATEADLMARAALALERIASKRPHSPAIANDNQSAAYRTYISSRSR